MGLISNQLWILIYLVYVTEGSKEQSKGITHFYRIREEGGSGSSIEGGGTSAFFQILAHGDTGAFLQTICWESFGN